MEKISISKIINQKYKSARVWFVLLLFIKLFAISLNLSLFFVDDTIIKEEYKVWLTLVILLCVTSLDFLFTNIFSLKSEEAEELRKIQFNQVNLHIESTPEELSYLIAGSTLAQNSAKNIEFDSSYFENQNLKYSLMQNIFFTSVLYRVHALFYWKVVALYGFLTLSFFGLSLYTSVTIGRLDLLYSKIFITLITSFFAYNFLPILRSFRKKSNELEALDHRLSAINSSNYNEVASVLIDYNNIIINAYPTFEFLYRRKRHQINSAWRIRLKENDSKASVTDEFEKLIKGKVMRLFLPGIKPSYIGVKYIGSIQDRSFIAGKSDLDVLLIFDLEEEMSPMDFYESIYYVLEAKYSFNLRKSIPGFIVHDFNDIIIEYTPCVQAKDEGFKIINNNEEWLTIYPDLHAKYFDELNIKSSFFYRKLLIEIKEWKYDYKIKVSSFYLQIVLSQLIETLDFSRTIGYNCILKRFYTVLLESQLKDVQDPLGKLGKISANFESPTVNYDNQIIERINYYNDKCNVSE